MTRDSWPEFRHTRVPVKRRPLSFVGVLGEVLIAGGLLVALFVGWQLFYTDVQGERNQAAVVANLDWATDPTDAANTAIADVTIPDAFKVTDEDPPETGHMNIANTFATMIVPRWGSSYVKPISEGTTRRDVLDPLGIGHYVGTQMPGEAGNFAVAAHRTTYGKPFNRVADLKAGDAVVIQTEGIWAVYHVTSWEIVQPSDTHVLATTPNDPNAGITGRFITMTTCHPMYSAKQRWVVYGELDYWAPVGHGIPAELAAPGATPTDGPPGEVSK